MPYRCSLAPGCATTSSQAGVRSSPNSNHTSPSRFSILPAECWRVLPSGRRAMARTCCSNWLVSHASMVMCPELCGRGAISLATSEPSVSTKNSMQSTPT
ncbi:hypothetical protein D9M68_700200 [compost metagenome]